MARPPEKLAQSLEILRNLQAADGAGAIRARDLRVRTGSASCATASSGSHQGLVYPEPPGRSEGREHGLVRIVLAFLRRRIWKRVSARAGACRRNNRSHCMPATGPFRGQLAARSPRAGNKVIKLLHGTSLLELRIALAGRGGPERKRRACVCSRWNRR